MLFESRTAGSSLQQKSLKKLTEHQTTDRQTDRRCGQLVGEHIGYLAAKEGDIFLQISDKSGFSFCYFRTLALW